MISIICACNNTELLNKMLLPSLKTQSYTDWEFINIDAKKEGFSSASETLNFGAEKAKGDILVFVHQDISFDDPNFITKIKQYCDLFDFGIAGVAGVLESERAVYSAVTMDYDKRQAGIKIIAPMEIDSLDECLLIIKKKDFKGFEDYGKTWHFYAVEYSLRCKMKQEKVMLFPLEIYHLSPGWSLDQSYWTTLKRVAKHFRSDFKIIPTTMGNYRNNCLLPLEIVLRKLKRKMKRG